MTCWPPCSPFCECIDGDCRPSMIQINAVRLKMLDGRYLVASGGGGASTGGKGAALIASTGGSLQWRTFLFTPPSMWPFASGDALSLAVCDSDWNASGNLVRVYHTGIRRKVPVSDVERFFFGQLYTDSYVLGGTDGGVFVNSGFSAGYPAYGYSGSDPLETEFSIIKVSGSASGTILDGDTVIIRIAQSYNDYGPFFFRVNASGSVEGDGADLGVPGGFAATPFIVEFLEVKGGGVGPRPNPVICRKCATVSVTVTDAGSHNPLPSAAVKASGTLDNQPFLLTGRNFGNGVFTFAIRTRAGLREICVPAGEISLLVTDERHELFSGPVTVPATGGINVPVALVCTKVSGFVVYDTVPPTPVSLATVWLKDSQGQVVDMVDVNPDGTFTFQCVKQGVISIGEDFADTLAPFVVGPEGKSGIVLVEHIHCGNVDGHARDDGGLPIENVNVAVVGTGKTASTDAAGYYNIPCVPAGLHKVKAIKSGYIQVPAQVAQLPNTNVPTTGTVTQDLKLRRTQLAIWNTGVDANNSPLGPGDPDPHWNVVRGPGVTAPQKALVLTNPSPLYYAPADSRWISLTADGIPGGPGDLTFRLDFDLSGFDPASVTIEGAWGVDNNGTITINGSSPNLSPPIGTGTPPIGTGILSMSGDSFGNFNSEHPFTISSGFVTGMNFLEVQVANFGIPGADNPTGFNVTKLMIRGTRLP